MKIWKHTKEHYKTHRMNGFSWILCVLMFIYAILLMVPVVFAFLSSFKSLGDFTDHMFTITKFTLENYKKVMGEFIYNVLLSDGSSGYYDFGGLALNSFLFAIGRCFCSTMTCIIVAYCSEKFDFVIGKILMSVVLIAMAVPIIGTTGASIEMTQNLGIHDTWFGVYFLACGFLGEKFLLYYGNFKSISNDYMEAAVMDGANNFTIFFRIMFPMVSSLFTFHMISGFMVSWSDYTTVMYFLPSKPTLSLAMLNFTSLPFTTVTMQMAGCMLLGIPSFALFLAFKDKFMQNMQVGGIKG